MKLLIDDEKNVENVDCICRTIGVAKIIIYTGIEWDVVYLDHDFGKGENGYDFLCWLEKIPKKFWPKKIELVTHNPIGRQRMQLVIDKMYGPN